MTTLQDAIHWCQQEASIQDLVLLLDEIVVLLRNAILAQDIPIQTVQDMIEQSLLVRGWNLANLAQISGVELPRLRQILDHEGLPPSSEELAAIAPTCFRPDGNPWDAAELEVLAKVQYGAQYYAQYTSLSMLILRNWDLLCRTPMPIKRLQALRDGAYPTEEDILRLVLHLRLEEAFVRNLANGAIDLLQG